MFNLETLIMDLERLKKKVRMAYREATGKEFDAKEFAQTLPKASLLAAVCCLFVFCFSSIIVAYSGDEEADEI